MALPQVSILQLPPDQIKKHDLCLRYGTAAERAFRLLEQFCKLHPSVESRPATPAEPDPKRPARLTVVGEDPTPTGLTLLFENIGSVENHHPKAVLPLPANRRPPIRRRQ